MPPLHSLSHAHAGLGALLPPPPTYSRLPPDGHEFPQDYRDPQTGFTVQVRRSERGYPLGLGE